MTHAAAGSSVVAASCGATGGRPVTHDLPFRGLRPGQRLKSRVRKHYRHSSPIVTLGSVMSYRDRYLSLDPTTPTRTVTATAHYPLRLARHETMMARLHRREIEESSRRVSPEKQATALIRPGDHYYVRFYNPPPTVRRDHGLESQHMWSTAISQSLGPADLFV